MSMRKESDLPEWLRNTGFEDLDDLDDQDAASLILPDLDYDAQMIAIRSFLHRNLKADNQLEKEIKNLEEYARSSSGFRNEQAVDEWVDRLHESVFQSAANSMSAAGMLAPFLESLFSQAFQGIRKQFSETRRADHPRWEAASDAQWNCRLVWREGMAKTNIVEGIVQLAEAVGLKPHLPADLMQTLQALFQYRNKMFHCGFEWPLAERIAFEKRIHQARWPADWFAKATVGDQPWVFYLTDVFITHCLDTVDRVIKGLGAFANQELERKISACRTEPRAH